jgi:hypothetical protein
MRHRLQLIMAALLVVGVIAWSAYSQKHQDEKKCFEYLVVTDVSLYDAQARLNELGEQGWELVAVQTYSRRGDTASTGYVLKRSK